MAWELREGGLLSPSLPRKQWRNGTRVLGCFFGPSQIQLDRALPLLSIGLGRDCTLLVCCDNCKLALFHMLLWAGYLRRGMFFF